MNSNHVTEWDILPRGLQRFPKRKRLGLFRPVPLTDKDSDQQKRNGSKATEDRARHHKSLLLRSSPGKDGIYNGGRSNHYGQRADQLKEGSEACKGGALIVIRCKLRGQRKEGNADKSLQGI